MLTELVRLDRDTLRQVAYRTACRSCRSFCIPYPRLGQRPQDYKVSTRSTSLNERLTEDGNCNCGYCSDAHQVIRGVDCSRCAARACCHQRLLYVHQDTTRFTRVPLSPTQPAKINCAEINCALGLTDLASKHRCAQYAHTNISVCTVMRLQRSVQSVVHRRPTREQLLTGRLSYPFPRFPGVYASIYLYIPRLIRTLKTLRLMDCLFV